MVTKEVLREIELLKGKYQPTEAFEIIDELIVQRIKSMKIENLRKWVGNHSCNTVHQEKMIKNLLEEKSALHAFCAQARKDGFDVEISGTIKMKIVKKAPVIQPVKISMSNN